MNFEIMRDERIVSSCKSKCMLFLAFGTILVFLGFVWQADESSLKIFGFSTKFQVRDSFRGSSSLDDQNIDSLEELIALGVYKDHDFINDLGIIPPYWGNVTDLLPLETTTKEWGPCFGSHDHVDWETEIEKSRGSIRPYYPTQAVGIEKNDWADHCRPGFLIIGAGKCGTSSLYHYLTDHPRVLPASKKQVHYFKYYADRSLKWYFSHFPTSKSFLASGALVTGEASPGYLPYPDVAAMIRQRLTSRPRIVVVGREPIDRAYSSYRYNYLSPTLESMRGGHMVGIKENQDDSYYEQFLFSFEDMIVSELVQLRECLSIPNGTAVSGARNTWGTQPWAVAEFERRSTLGLDPLVDLDGFCYGGQITRRFIRKQWKSLFEKYPKKIIPNKNLHLTQAMIGRGLYTLPLEWWYAIFDSSDIHFLCTEELRDLTGEPLNKLGQFLGLPSFNFSETVRRGAYNVGSHHGYDNEVSWDELQDEHSLNETDALDVIKEEIPLSPETRRDLENFVRPFNERLFKLVGRRCDW